VCVCVSKQTLGHVWYSQRNSTQVGTNMQSPNIMMLTNQEPEITKELQSLVWDSKKSPCQFSNCGPENPEILRTSGELVRAYKALPTDCVSNCPAWHVIRRSPRHRPTIQLDIHPTRCVQCEILTIRITVTRVGRCNSFLLTYNDWAIHFRIAEHMLQCTHATVARPKRTK
jgi:hypothetical protein